MLRRAIAILEKEMSKGAFLQTNSMQEVADALSSLVSGAAALALLLQGWVEAQKGESSDIVEYVSWKGVLREKFLNDVMN